MICQSGREFPDRPYRGTDPLYPSFRVREGAVLFGEANARQDDMGQSSAVSVRKMS